MTIQADRELLELAARAAGLWDAANNCIDIPWDPLANDADSFRLAVKLQMDTLGDGTLADGQPCMSVIFPLAGDYECISEIVHGGDDYAAIRRAIVRAAAAIGKEMP